MTDQGYHKTQTDHCMFVKKFEGGDFLILLLYLDDMLIIGRDQAKIRKTKAEKADMMKVPYAFVVGSLMYAMVCTRPDIGYAVGVVSRFMSNPSKEHWNAVS